MRFLVTGAGGYLGRYLLRSLSHQGRPVAAWSHSQTGRCGDVSLEPVDLAEPAQISDALARARPDAVIHAAGLTTVAKCFQDPAEAERVNVRGTAVLAELAERHAARLVFVSTDLVFDGEKGAYETHDIPSPMTIYGCTKYAAERAVLAVSRSVVVRVSLLFGPSLSARPSFFDQQCQALRKQMPLTLFHDEWRTPLDLVSAADALIAIAESEIGGILHLGGPERISRWEMGLRLARELDVDPSPIASVSRTSIESPEPRPKDTSLDSTKWRTLFPQQPWRSWDEALRAFPSVCGSSF